MATGSLDLSSTIGAAYWGFVVSAVLFGCIVVQGSIYYSSYARDSLVLKIFVGVMIVLDGLITFFAAQSFSYVLVTKYGDNIALLYMTDSILAEYISTWIVVTASQIFYASRVYIVNKKLWYIPASIVALALASQAAIIVLFCKLFQEDRLVASLQKREFIILSSLTSSISCLADVIATAAMCYFLASHRSGFRKTRQLINTLIFYTVNRGVMVAVCQIVVLVIFAVTVQADLWWLPPHLCLSKFHVITLLALLNSRSRSRPQSSDDNILSAIVTDKTTMPGSRGKDKPNSQRFAFGTSHKREDAFGSSPDSIVFAFRPASTISQSGDRSDVYFANANNENGEELDASEGIGAVV